MAGWGEKSQRLAPLQRQTLADRVVYHVEVAAEEKLVNSLKPEQSSLVWPLQSKQQSLSALLNSSLCLTSDGSPVTFRCLYHTVGFSHAAEREMYQIRWWEDVNERV